MKRTNDEIIKKGEEILKAIEFGYDKSIAIEVRSIDLEKETFQGFDKPTWQVSVKFGADMYGNNRYAFLFIDDETGKPIYLQHSTGKIDFDWVK
jgi:hypothetical protein